MFRSKLKNILSTEIIARNLNLLHLMVLHLMVQHQQRLHHVKQFFLHRVNTYDEDLWAEFWAQQV